MKELYEKLKVVDIDEDELIELYAMEGDTARCINFKFKNGVNIIDLTDCKVRINAINSKYNAIFNDLTIIDGKRGIAQLKLTTALLTPGTTLYQLKITGSPGELKPKIMRLIVEARLNNDGAIEGSNEFTALENAMNEVDRLIKTGNETNKSLADNVKNATGLKLGLDSSIDNANASKRNLDSSISTSNTLKDNLISLNNTAQNTKEELNATITKGDTVKMKQMLENLSKLIGEVEINKILNGGYFKIGGLILQWGYVNVTNGLIIKLPIPLNNVDYNIQITPYAGPGGAPSIKAYHQEKTGFTVESNKDGYSAFWLTIGWMK